MFVVRCELFSLSLKNFVCWLRITRSTTTLGTRDTTCQKIRFSHQSVENQSVAWAVNLTRTILANHDEFKWILKHRRDTASIDPAPLVQVKPTRVELSLSRWDTRCSLAYMMTASQNLRNSFNAMHWCKCNWSKQLTQSRQSNISYETPEMSKTRPDVFSTKSRAQALHNRKWSARPFNT